MLLTQKIIIPHTQSKYAPQGVYEGIIASLSLLLLLKAKFFGTLKAERKKFGTKLSLIGTKHLILGFKDLIFGTILFFFGAKHPILGTKHPILGAKDLILGAKHPIFGAPFNHKYLKINNLTKNN